MPQTLLAGLATTSHDQGTSASATYTSVAVASGLFPAPGQVCPTGYSCADIGAVTPAGGQTVPNTNWTVTAGGPDIWGTADAFHYIWAPLPANGAISTQVASITATDPWARAGAMVRATTSPGSPFYAIYVSKGNGVVVQERTAQGATAIQIANTTGTAPEYVEVTRTGTVYAAATSTNGTTWTTVPGSTLTLANLSGSLLRGLAITSHSSGNPGSASFDTVTTSP